MFADAVAQKILHRLTDARIDAIVSERVLEIAERLVREEIDRIRPTPSRRPSPAPFSPVPQGEAAPCARRSGCPSIPAARPEYARRHQPIWPELEAVLREHGVREYSIFLDPETRDLFGYVEIEDEARWNAIADTDVCRRWWTSMRELMPSHADDSPVSRDLPEVFHLESHAVPGHARRHRSRRRQRPRLPRPRSTRAARALEEVHRFTYAPASARRTPAVGHAALQALRRPARRRARRAPRGAPASRVLDAIGVDAWGVDYGLIDAAGPLVEDPIAYRDRAPRA